MCEVCLDVRSKHFIGPILKYNFGTYISYGNLKIGFVTHVLGLVVAVYVIPYFTIIQTHCFLTLFISRLVEMAKSKNHTNHNQSKYTGVENPCC